MQDRQRQMVSRLGAFEANRINQRWRCRRYYFIMKLWFCVFSRMKSISSGGLAVELFNLRLSSTLFRWIYLIDRLHFDIIADSQDTISLETYGDVFINWNWMKWTVWELISIGFSRIRWSGEQSSVHKELVILLNPVHWSQNTTFYEIPEL